MPWLLCAVVLAVSCTKNEPATSADPAPTAKAETPPQPPAPPPQKDPHDAAVDAAIAILSAVSPITKEWGDEGKDCEKGVPELEKVLDGMKTQQAVVQEVLKTPESGGRFTTAFFKQDGSPLAEARSGALGPALHCPALADRIYKVFGITMPK